MAEGPAEGEARVSRPDLSPLGERALCAIAANGGQSSRAALAKAIGSPMGTMTALVRRLVGRGYVRELSRVEGDLSRASQLELTGRGQARIAPPAPGPAKPKVPLTRAAFDLLKGIHVLQEGELEVSVPALMSWSGKSRGAVGSILETLRARKVLAQDYVLTERGLDLVEGRAVITRPQASGQRPPYPRAVKAPPPASAGPASAPPPAPRDESLPRAKYIDGRLVHPPIPQPSTKPDGISEGSWRARTVLQTPAAGWR